MIREKYFFSFGEKSEDLFKTLFSFVVVVVIVVVIVVVAVSK